MELTENISDTSAGMKISDVRARHPLKRKKFITEDDILHNLQSHNTTFWMNIILMEGTKESFKLFQVVYQFF